MDCDGVVIDITCTGRTLSYPRLSRGINDVTTTPDCRSAREGTGPVLFGRPGLGLGLGLDAQNCTFLVTCTPNGKIPASPPNQQGTLFIFYHHPSLEKAPTGRRSEPL